MRSIIVASGKGGVGKTTVALNLALLLSQAGKKTAIIDADTAMANIGIMLGVDRAPINLHNVLMGEADIKDAVYEGPNKLKYVPSGLSYEKVKKLDYSKLAAAVEELEGNFDYVIIDAPPGLSRSEEEILKSAKEMLLVTIPEPTALADALKVKNFADRNGIQIIGLVANRVLHDPHEIKSQDIETLLGTRMLVQIPEDLAVRRASASQTPLLIKTPSSPAATEIKRLANAIAGVPMAGETAARKSFLQTIIDMILGRH